MSGENTSGKISPSFMGNVIYPNLGARRSEILVGPGAGLDTCVIDLGHDQALVASTDPLSLIPLLGAEDSAWMSVNLLVNDLSTSGLSPQYMMVDLNLPPSITNDILTAYWKTLSEECATLGISIIGGNTGKFEGCDLTIVGSGTTLAIGRRKNIVVSNGARQGNAVIITKGAAISTTGLLAKIFAKTVSKKLGGGIQRRCEACFRKISVMKDAMLAVSLGTGNLGVTAMHDVAEGGVLASLMELAAASSLGMSIDKSRIPISEETISLCDFFEIDPYWSLGEGALAVACIEEKSLEIVEELTKGGVEAAIVGKMVSKNEGITLTQDGEKFPITRPSTDPYWNAYYSAIAKKWV